MMNNLIERTIAFVQEELKDAEAGHDWFHIERVYRNAQHLLTLEQGNPTVVLLAALLHDIADSKFHNGDETIGPKKAYEFMQKINVPTDIALHVKKIIENISFKGGHNPRTFQSIELDITQDADRLDALGAIGIARAFHYGGYKNRILFDPEQNPKLNMTKEEYKIYEGTTINHFYEKLLLLKDRMNTNTGKKLAEQRHEFMLSYLKQFDAEFQGIL